MHLSGGHHVHGRQLRGPRVAVARVMVAGVTAGVLVGATVGVLMAGTAARVLATAPRRGRGRARGESSEKTAWG